MRILLANVFSTIKAWYSNATPTESSPHLALLQTRGCSAAVYRRNSLIINELIFYWKHPTPTIQTLKQSIECEIPGFNIHPSLGYLPIYTIKICTSLGFTPLIRLAWPSVLGLIFLNFCSASADIAEILS